MSTEDQIDQASADLSSINEGLREIGRQLAWTSGYVAGRLDQRQDTRHARLSAASEAAGRAATSLRSAQRLAIASAILSCIVIVAVLLAGCGSRPHAPAPKWQVTECKLQLRTRAPENAPACGTLTAKQYDAAVLDAQRWADLHPNG